MDSLTELFCLIDDFFVKFEPAWHKRLLGDGQKHRRRQTRLQLSELMTLAVLFHQLRFRHFKTFYLAYVCRFLRQEFPDLPSYYRCVELMPRCAVPLAALFDMLKRQCSGISIVDSTPIAVCDNLRIPRHKVFAGLAARGKSSTGWFFGFKLHVVINHRGEILPFALPQAMSTTASRGQGCAKACSASCWATRAIWPDGYRTCWQSSMCT